MENKVSVDEYAAALFSNEMELIILDLEHLRNQVEKTMIRITETMETVRAFKEKIDNYGQA